MNSLKAEKISFSYSAFEPILENISFNLRAAETLGILGPNGGGKSTLMRILAGLLKPTNGKLQFNDLTITSNDPFPFHLISYVPQSSQLNTTLPLSVRDYLQYAKCALNKNIPMSDENNLLEMVGVIHKKDSLISNLSGGERQRVLIARAMLNNPSFLLLDEPTKGLDGRGQDQLLTLLKKIKNENQTAIIIVDHNINQIIRNCDNLLCLNRTSHWHDKTELITKNVLEDIYHCELEHLLIHENDIQNNRIISESTTHLYCDHDHNQDHSHAFLRRKK